MSCLAASWFSNALFALASAADTTCNAVLRARARASCILALSAARLVDSSLMRLSSVSLAVCTSAFASTNSCPLRSSIS
eukprot:7818689-Heterocapsa_arctica.AAC.2